MVDKRRYFLIISFVFSALFFVLGKVPFIFRPQFAGLLVIVVVGASLILFKSFTAKLKNSVFAVLPSFVFTIALVFFHFLVPQNFLWQVFLTIFFGLNFYTFLLCANVFLVAAEFKTVPLYRAAATISFLQMLATAFFLFDVIFSFRFPAYINGLLAGAASAMLFINFFWSQAIVSPEPVDILEGSFVFALLMAEIAMILSFWPVGIGKGSLYLVSLFYVFGGLASAFCQMKLFKRTVAEFLWIGAGTFLGLFLVTSWRG